MVSLTAITVIALVVLSSIAGLLWLVFTVGRNVGESDGGIATRELYQQGAQEREQQLVAAESNYLKLKWTAAEDSERLHKLLRDQTVALGQAQKELTDTKEQIASARERLNSVRVSLDLLNVLLSPSDELSTEEVWSVPDEVACCDMGTSDTHQDNGAL